MSIIVATTTHHFWAWSMETSGNTHTHTPPSTHPPSVLLLTLSDNASQVVEHMICFPGFHFPKWKHSADNRRGGSNRSVKVSGLTAAFVYAAESIYVADELQGTASICSHAIAFPSIYFNVVRSNSTT